MSHKGESRADPHDSSHDHAPRAPPALHAAPAPIPRDPAARDHQWPDQWPLRTHLELAALNTAPGCARAHACAVLHEWHADADFTNLRPPLSCPNC